MFARVFVSVPLVLIQPRFARRERLTADGVSTKVSSPSSLPPFLLLRFS